MAVGGEADAAKGFSGWAGSGRPHPKNIRPPQHTTSRNSVHNGTALGVTPRTNVETRREDFRGTAEFIECRMSCNGRPGPSPAGCTISRPG